MSIEAELNGKTGQVCKHAKAGSIQCPLLIRPTSEDVISGNCFGMLRHVRPHLWLGPLLNLGLGTRRFRGIWYKNLRMEFWKRVASYPAELLDFKEGKTEPDLVISWENPATTCVIESKYLSPLATHTSNSETNDQAIRGIRTLLAGTGHITTPSLIPRPKRDAIWLALLITKPDPIVEQYRDHDRLMQGIGRADAVTSLPPAPFVGTITWDDIITVLKASHARMMPGEKSIADSLMTYLALKVSQAATERRKRFTQLGISGRTKPVSGAGLVSPRGRLAAVS